MIIISDTTQFHIPERTVVAFGKFDGIHIGHRLLFSEVLGAAKDNGYKSLVFTFSPSPLVFFGTGEQKELSTLPEKRALFEELGFDYLVEFPLTKETAATKPQDFVREFLSEKMNAAMIFAGDDVSFGDKGLGNSILLQKMSLALDYELHIIGKKYYEGNVISSTLVRNLIGEGNMQKAGLLLGKPYSVEIRREKTEDGKVFFGTDREKLLPPKGVYNAVLWDADGKSVEAEAVVEDTLSVSLMASNIPQNLSADRATLEFL